MRVFSLSLIVASAALLGCGGDPPTADMNAAKQAKQKENPAIDGTSNDQAREIGHDDNDLEGLDLHARLQVIRPRDNNLITWLQSCTYRDTITLGQARFDSTLEDPLGIWRVNPD